MSITKDLLIEHIYYASLIYMCPDRVKSQKNIGDILLSNDDKKSELFTSFINHCSPSGEVCYYNYNKKDVQYGLILNHANKYITLVFRGSESYVDWIYDLIVLKESIMNDKKLQVHKGFNMQLICDNTYNRIETLMMKYIDKYPTYKIYVTGHSAGAALSTLYAFYFSQMLEKNRIDKKIICISFASPRVGNITFKAKINDSRYVEHYRCYNSHDVVSIVPNYKYYHCGYPIRMDKKSNKLYSKKDKRQYLNYFRWWRINDHLCDTYCNRIVNNELVTYT